MKKVCGAIFRISDAHPLNKCILPINHTGPHTTVKTPTAAEGERPREWKIPAEETDIAQGDREAVQTEISAMLGSIRSSLISRADGINTGGDIVVMEAVDRIVQREGNKSSPLSAEELAALRDVVIGIRAYIGAAWTHKEVSDDVFREVAGRAERGMKEVERLERLPGVAVVRNKSEEPTNELSKWIKVVPKGNELERLKQVERDYKALLTAIDIVHEGHYGAAMNAVLEDYPKLRYIYLGGKK